MPHEAAEPGGVCGGPPYSIREMLSDEDVKRSFAALGTLRQHLSVEQYVTLVREMRRECFHLAAVELAGEVVAVAGFRVMTLLYTGTQTLYVDDLVTAPALQSQGLGQALMSWVAAWGRTQGCSHIHLSSGVARHGAHRFYLQQRFDITAYHFWRKL